MRQLYRKGIVVPAHGRLRAGRRRPGGGGLQHGRAAGRPGAPDRPQDDGARRHHDGGVPRAEVPRGDVARDRRRQLHPALHGRRDAGPAGDRRRLHGARVPRGPDDQLRHPRSPDVPAHPGRRARQRGGGGARGLLEVDGAHQPQGLRGGGLDRLHLQGPAHRQGDQGVRDPRLHHQGHRDRPGGAGRAAGPPRSDRRGARGRGRHQDLQRQDPRHRAPHHRGLPPRHRDHRGPRSTSGATPSRSRSRTSSRSAGSTASRGS